MADVTITPSDNGPYLVRGGAKLVDQEGKEFQTGDTIALCRCGQSEHKPFCDGAHAKIEFKSQSRVS